MTGKNRLESEQIERGGAIGTGVPAENRRKCHDQVAQPAGNRGIRYSVMPNPWSAHASHVQLSTQMSGGVARRTPSGKYRLLRLRCPAA
jgi:hypothetical protein